MASLPNNDLNDGNISVIDGATNTLTTVVVDFATGSQEIAVNPQNNKIYVVNKRSNNVTLLDGATKRLPRFRLETSNRDQKETCPLPTPRRRAMEPTVRLELTTC